jgi:hypothetical protein
MSDGEESGADGGSEENPLVPGDTNNAAFSNFHSVSQGFEGSGIFSDAASTIGDISSGNWGGVAADAVGDGLDALGVAMDPLGSLLGAGIGWLIEHISFLKKPLDLLAGDPDAVTRKATTWTNISNQLIKSADDYTASAQALSEQHKGAAADAYQTAAQNYTKTVQAAATHAQSAAKAMTVAGTVVGTTRGLVRDSLSQFAGDAIVKFIAASALAPVTFGATEAAFIVDEVAEGTSLAAKFGSKMSEVAQTLDKLAKGGSESAKVLSETGESLAKDAGKTVESAAKDAAKGGEDAAKAGKDATKAGEDAAKGGEDAAKGGKDAEEAENSATKLNEYNEKADDLNKRVGDHNKAVAAKQDQIADLQRRIDEAPNAAKKASLQHYLDDTVKPGAQKLEDAGKKLDKERDAVAKERGEAWKMGAQERTTGKIPGLSLDGKLGQAHEYLENHQVLDKSVEGSVEAAKQQFSDQPLRTQEVGEDSDEDLEKYEEEHPNFRGSLIEEPEKADAK